MKIGVIGLGSMGYGMAMSLLRAGHEVWGFDISAAQVDTFISEGGLSGDIADVKISTRDENTACMSITLVVNDRNQLSRIVRSLRRERCILHVRRTVGEKKEQK